MTKLAAKYDRLDKAIKTMGAKRDELNANLKVELEELFNAEDSVLTRIVETASFTIQLAKQADKAPEKTEIDYEKIAAELMTLIPEELTSKVEEIVAAYTKILKQTPKSPALTVKAKINESFESIAGELKTLLKSLVKGIAGWANRFDRKLAKLQQQAGLRTV